jgi:hypothetical protein
MAIGIIPFLLISKYVKLFLRNYLTAFAAIAAVPKFAANPVKIVFPPEKSCSQARWER